MEGETQPGSERRSTPGGAPLAARRVLLRGLVQGVGLRWQAREEAGRLRVTGWIANREDGAVEAHLEGSEERLAAMLAWLERGPAGARIEALEVEPAPPEGIEAFEIRRLGS